MVQRVTINKTSKRGVYLVKGGGFKSSVVKGKTQAKLVAGSKRRRAKYS